MKVKIPGTGVTYDSVDEAIADVDRMEALREDEISYLREQGDEAGADRAGDRWNKQIQKTRDAIRGAQEREAGATSQPRNRPKGRAKSGGAGAGQKETAGGASGRRRRARTPGAPLFARPFLGRAARSLNSGASGRILRDTGATRASSSITKLVLQLFGLLVGLALVLLILESEGQKRSVAGGAVDFLIRAVGAIVDPVDPFTREAWRSSSAAPASTPTVTTQRPATTTVVRQGAR